MNALLCVIFLAMTGVSPTLAAYWWTNCADFLFFVENNNFVRDLELSITRKGNEDFYFSVNLPSNRTVSQYVDVERIDECLAKASSIKLLYPGFFGPPADIVPNHFDLLLNLTGPDGRMEGLRQNCKIRHNSDVSTSKVSDICKKSDDKGNSDGQMRIQEHGLYNLKVHVEGFGTLYTRFFKKSGGQTGKPTPDIPGVDLGNIPVILPNLAGPSGAQSALWVVIGIQFAVIAILAIVCALVWRKPVVGTGTPSVWMDWLRMKLMKRERKAANDSPVCALGS